MIKEEAQFQWDEKLMRDKDVNTANTTLLSAMDEVRRII